MSDAMRSPGRSIGFRLGLIIGLLNVIVGLLMYIIDFRAGVRNYFMISIALFIIVIVAMVISARQTRTALGGYADFKTLVQPAFVTFVIAELLNTVFFYALYNFIDPSLVDVLREETISLTADWMTQMGAPEEEVEKQVNALAEQDFSSLGAFARQLMFLFPVGFTISAIIALILRRSRPMMVAVEEEDNVEVNG